MSSIQDLEREFTQALQRGPRLQYESAHEVLGKIRPRCRDRQRVTIFEVALDYRETHRYGANMKRLFDEIIRRPIKDPQVYVSALMMCTKLYGYERTDITGRVMLAVDQHATNFFSGLSHPRAVDWLSGYAYNLGVLAVRHHELDLAGDKLAVAIQCYRETGVAWWWIPLCFVQFCLLYTKEERFATAHVSLQEVSKFDPPQETHGWYLFAAAYLAYEEKGDVETAAAYLHAAYAEAGQGGDYFLLSDILLLQGVLYADTRNHPAFWYAYEICQGVEKQHGVPVHVAFHNLAKQVPALPRKVVIENA